MNCAPDVLSLLNGNTSIPLKLSLSFHVDDISKLIVACNAPPFGVVKLRRTGRSVCFSADNFALEIVNTPLSGASGISAASTLMVRSESDSANAERMAARTDSSAKTDSLSTTFEPRVACARRSEAKVFRSVDDILVLRPHGSLNRR